MEAGAPPRLFPAQELRFKPGPSRVPTQQPQGEDNDCVDGPAEDSEEAAFKGLQAIKRHKLQKKHARKSAVKSEVKAEPPDDPDDPSGSSDTEVHHAPSMEVVAIHAKPAMKSSSVPTPKVVPKRSDKSGTLSLKYFAKANYVKPKVTKKRSEVDHIQKHRKQTLYRCQESCSERRLQR